VPSLSRAQLLVYCATAVALLLLGARWIRSADAEGSGAGEISYSAAAGSGDGEEWGGDGGASEAVSFQAEGDDVVVHVAGAVRRPGVYRLPGGSRVTDAIDRAGGATPAASLESINLAARLADGQQVVLPGAASSGAGVATATGSSAPDPDVPISLGTATMEQLDTIEGIGPVTAESILTYRDEHGGLSSVEDLDALSGIGPATMEALRSRLQP
jgi:competence protein ComEA